MPAASTSRALAVAALTTGTLATAPTAAAQSDPIESAPTPEEHCLVNVLGQEDDGRYVTDEPTCYPTFAEVLAAIGGGAPARLGQRSALLGAPIFAPMSSTLLARHFDGANQTGSSITVNGVACDGGYVNLSSTWVNRISSATNSCPNVNYYDGYDKTGSSEFTSGLGNKSLSTLNNAANSVGYA
jgi:hypothetical protein